MQRGGGGGGGGDFFIDLLQSLSMKRDRKELCGKIEFSFFGIYSKVK